MNEKIKEEIYGIKILLNLLLPLIIVIIFGNSILNSVSQDFIKNYITIIAISIFGLGFTALEMRGPKELKRDLFDATIYMMFSVLFGLIYLCYQASLIFNLTFGHFSIIFFLGGFISFFVIIIKSKYNLYD